jgi:hypothetical protein
MKKKNESNQMKKLKEISARFSTPFNSVSPADVTERILSSSVDELIAFINKSSEVKEVTTKKKTSVNIITNDAKKVVTERPSHVKSGRMKKFTRVDFTWRADKLRELSETGKVEVNSKKEAVALYNFLLHNENVKISYKRRGLKKFDVIRK